MATTSINFSSPLEFIKEYLGDSKVKVLEIGSAQDRMTKALTEAGYQATAIEITELIDYDTLDVYDVVLFNRSLHQAAHLGKAFDKTKKLLGERGRVIVEDFSLEQMDEPTAEWFYELRDVVDLLTGTLSTPGETPLDRWKAEHHYEPAPHSRRDMFGALESKFGNVHAVEAPYLFHYFSGTQAVDRVLQWEKRLIKKEKIRPIGLRVVAKKYFSYLK